MRATLILCSALLLVALPALADKEAFPGVQKLMSEEEYRAAGLHKLSAEERQALDQWLLLYTATEAGTIRQTNQEVQEAEASHVINANIVGDFSGWSGNTLFRLDNGQLWRQRLPGKVAYNGDGRAVEISKNFFGFYKMTHIDSGRSVGVSRVE